MACWRYATARAPPNAAAAADADAADADAAAADATAATATAARRECTGPGFHPGT